MAGADRMSLDLVFTSRGKREANEVFEKMNIGLGLSCGARSMVCGCFTAMAAP